MKGLHEQLRICFWNIKNNKWIHIVIVVLFLILIPLMGFMFAFGMQDNNAAVVYGHTIYVAETILSVIGMVPLLLNLHGAYHYASGECVIICPKWKENRFFQVCFLYTGVLVVIMMLLLMAIYQRYVEPVLMLQDLVDFLIILLVLLAISHFLTRVTNSVFVGLIVTEIYSIACWLLGLGTHLPVNIYSIELLSGFSWFARILVYIAFAIFLETITLQIRKRQRKSEC